MLEVVAERREEKGQALFVGEAGEDARELGEVEDGLCDKEMRFRPYGYE
jgi:hypothetical protein